MKSFNDCLKAVVIELGHTDVKSFIKNVDAAMAIEVSTIAADLYADEVGQAMKVRIINSIKKTDVL